MKSEKRVALQLMVAEVEALGSSPDDAEMESVISRHGGRIAFVGGTNQIRMGGVAGTGTSGPDAAMASWLRAARRRLGDPK